MFSAYAVRKCEICGKHRGYSGKIKVDHSSCSKILQERKLAEPKKRKAPKYTAKRIDFMTKSVKRYD